MRCRSYSIAPRPLWVILFFKNIRCVVAVHRFDSWRGSANRKASGPVSRVLSWDGYLFRTRVARALARNPSARRATVWRSYLRLLQMGFTKPRRCRRAGALLPHRFSFSPVSRMLRIAACSEQGSLLFCGTDPSGRPAQPLLASCPAEPGLSSHPERVRGRLACLAWYCSRTCFHPGRTIDE